MRPVADGVHRDLKPANVRDTVTGVPFGPPLPPAPLHGRFVSSPDGKSFVAGLDHYRVAHLRLPVPAEGSAERLRLWAETITGQELTDAGRPVYLDADAWAARRQRLQELGGPP